MKDGDVKKVNGEWFMYLEYFDSCDSCDAEFNKNIWINIQKAVDKINSKPSDNNDLKKVCLQCGGTGIMGNEESNAECDSCHGSGKPIIKS